jgi:hypothetical protein
MSASGDNPAQVLDPQEGIVGMVTVAIVLAVAVLIVGQIFGALPAPTGALSGAYDQVETLTAQAFELAPVVLIVIVAAIVIRQVKIVG